MTGPKAQSCLIEHHRGEFHPPLCHKAPSQAKMQLLGKRDKRGAGCQDTAEMT